MSRPSIQKRIKAIRPVPVTMQDIAHERPSPSARGYDREWQRVRAEHLRHEPFCRICKHPATQVDHIVPIRKGGHRLDHANLQSLCVACHSRKTAKNDDGFGNKKGKR